MSNIRRLGTCMIDADASWGNSLKMKPSDDDKGANAMMIKGQMRL
jgi:hypothetical protein